MKSNPANESDHALFRNFFIAGIALLAACRLLFLFYMPYNLDELARVHLVWLDSHGWRIFYDDPDLAPPFLRWMILPLAILLGESRVYCYRFAFFAISFFSVYLLFHVIRADTRSKFASLAACFAFICSVPFMLSAQQVRYEAFVLFFFLLAFVLIRKATENEFRPILIFVSGLFLGYGCCVKPHILPFAISLVIVEWNSFRKNRTSHLFRTSFLFAVGILIPAIALFFWYLPFIKVLFQAQGNLFFPFLRVSASLSSQMRNAGAFQLLGWDILLWLSGLIGLLVVFRRRLFHGAVPLQTAMLGSFFFLLSIPIHSRQIYLQDLVFPALAFSIIVGYAADSLAQSGSKRIALAALFILALEGMTSSALSIFLPSRATAAQQSLWDDTVSFFSRGDEAFPVSMMMTRLYKSLPFSSYTDRMSRFEQDAAVDYFSKNVRNGETSVASNALNVFSPSPTDWAMGMRGISDVGVEFLYDIGQRLPDPVWKFFACRNAARLIEKRTSGIEENLVRELEYSRPEIILADRFMVNLWFRYPDYLALVDANFFLRFESRSKQIYALRINGDWQPAGLAPLPALDCAPGF
jgi:hypothetical protein